MDQPVEKIPLTAYRVWDRTTRWFHWVNVLCVLALAGIGTAILLGSTLGISAEGKVSLKIWHAYAGYVFALNLLWRLLWGFMGGHYARWSVILPGGRGYVRALKDYIRGFASGNSPAYKGHNPLGRLMVTVLFLLLGAQMVTGLVLAGTDLYFPPFGHEFAEMATSAGEDHSRLVGLRPGSKEFTDPEGYARMRALREPFIAIHELSFFALRFAITLHVLAVVVTEVKDRHGIVSAMFTGSKILDRKPQD